MAKPLVTAMSRFVRWPSVVLAGQSGFLMVGWAHNSVSGRSVVVNTVWDNHATAKSESQAKSRRFAGVWQGLWHYVASHWPARHWWEPVSLGEPLGYDGRMVHKK